MTTTDPADVSLAMQKIVYAGLDLLVATIPLDLCAYVHEPAGAGPQLYVRAPRLGAMEAETAFRLFAELRDALGTAPDGSEIRVSGYHARGLFSAGAASRGLHAVGRSGGGLSGEESAAAFRACRAIAAACHALEPAVRA